MTWLALVKIDICKALSSWAANFRHIWQYFFFIVQTPQHPQQNQPSSLKLPDKPAPVLRPSTCQARKIYNNATLLGGMRAGNYTPLGKATHLQDCIGRACDLNEGHLALMLGQYCYSVMCHNQRICQTIPAKPTHLRPKVAYLAWTQEPIEQDTSMNSFFSGYYFLKLGIYR